MASAQLASESSLDGTRRIGESPQMSFSVPHPTALLIALLIGGGVGVAVYAWIDGGGKSSDEPPTAKVASPDTPPAEFIYLDSRRVLAYLGQIEGGLAATQKRMLNTTTSRQASLTAKDIAAVEASTATSRTSSETVTLTEADQFYTLLRILRADQGDRNFRRLEDIHANVQNERDVSGVRSQLRRVQEGDFVRIKYAHVYVPTYAAVLKRARFASYYLGGNLRRPEKPLYAPGSTTDREVVRRYQASLGSNPRIPMFVPTLDQAHTLRQVVTFYLPALYDSLSLEPSLLDGTVTIVGKLVYKSPDLASQAATSEPPRPPYFDRETLTTFAPALRRANQSLLTRLKLGQKRLIAQVRRSLTIAPPGAVVIPLAIYQ